MALGHLWIQGNQLSQFAQDRGGSWEARLSVQKLGKSWANWDILVIPPGAACEAPLSTGRALWVHGRGHMSTEVPGDALALPVSLR